MEVSNETIWLIAGVILVTLEFIAISGVGLMFAGIGALLAGTALGLEPNLTTASQWIIFLATTIISAAILFKPLKNYSKCKGSYNDMVGQKAVVIGGLQAGIDGQVKWSGTIMRAKSATTHADGASVTITAVDGNILVVE